jgi:hypothetical protein
MKLGAAFLAEDAMPNIDGTFAVWRGGITDAWVPKLPGPVKYVLVLRLELDDQEVGQLHRLRLTTFHGGARVSETNVPIAMRVIPGEIRYYLNVLMPIQFVAASEGEGHIEAVIDDTERLPHQHFRVREGMPPILVSPPFRSPSP